jgi:hypothetical protein
LAYNRLVFPLLLILGILAVISLWGFLLWMLLRTVFTVLSGWNGLAQRYRAGTPPPVWDWYGQTVKVGAVRYRHSMRVAARPDGLYLGGSALLWHTPLRVPWSEMVNARKSSFYGKAAVAVDVGSPRVGTLEFPAELYSAIWKTATRR